MLKFSLSCFCAFAGLASVPMVASPTMEVPLEAGEYWWGGAVVDGGTMPFSGRSMAARNLYGYLGGNQAQPLLLSSRGRFFWSEEPLSYQFKNGNLTLTSTAAVEKGRGGNTLREAFIAASDRYFHASGKLPDQLLFRRPQYNTWIELMYDQNQADILAYARAVIHYGYPPGVLMIDDNWQETYGDWMFSARRFPDPKAMMEELHRLGFKVMLWVCPFVSADTANFRYLQKQNLLLRAAGEAEAPALVKWWNGYSACLDLTRPATVDWFKAQLDHLVTVYGVDGFKFDAGDPEFYRHTVAHDARFSPNDHSTAWARLGLSYPLNEYRACWKLAGQPLAQRLADKMHAWSDLQLLIPQIIAQGLMGYSFVCPDMIGGGEFNSFLDGRKFEPELVVRSAQVHALMPMMQFSVAPWRVLSSEQSALCRQMAELHVKFGDIITALANQSAQTGEPIVRPLCWGWPNQGYEEIRDQFMLGSDWLVAPVLEAGARRRIVHFPPGRWEGDDGSIVVGPLVTGIDAPLSRLPYYRLIP